jgi:hypothetical protein
VKAIAWRSAIGGLLMLVLALAFIAGSLQLDLGTARRMGPAYLPLAAGTILALLAVAIVITALMEKELAEKPHWVSAVAIGGGLATFAIVTPLWGILPGTFCTVIAASLPDRRLTLPGKLLLGLVVTAGIWVVFIVGLGLPFTAFRGF